MLARAKADAEAARAELARVKLAADAARMAAAKEREGAQRAKAEAEAARLAAANDRSVAARATTVTTRTAQSPAAAPTATPRLTTTVVDPRDTNDDAPSSAWRVRAVDYRGSEGQGDVEIALTGDVRITEGVATKMYAELIVDGVELPGSFEGKRDVIKYGSPLRTLTIVRDPRIAKRFYVRAALLAPGDPIREARRDRRALALSGPGHAVRLRELRVEIARGSRDPHHI